MKNPNHPKKGSKIKVEPIRKLKDIGLIKKLLADKPRDFALFTLGINTNLRASDMMQITAGMVRYLEPGDDFEIIERKTKKLRRITLNKNVIDALTVLVRSKDYADKDLLFEGQRGLLTSPSMTRLVKGWCKAVNLKGNYGSHSLRKTWGFHQRKTFNVDIPTLMVCFNHSTQRQTLDYLCIQSQEIKDVFSNQL